MSIMAAIKQGWNVTRNVLVKNAPKIAVAVGSGMVLGGTVDACRQTLKASSVLDEHNKKMEDIHKALELASAEEIVYTETDRKKDTVQTYVGTVFNFGKLYWRPALLIGGGFASIFTGFRVLNARHVAALGAFATLSDQFNEYRGRAIEEYGPEADVKLLNGSSDNSQPTKASINVRNEEDGEEKEVEVDTVDLNAVNGNSFVFDFNYKNPKWDSISFLYNDNFINRIQKRFQLSFESNSIDHLFVGDLYKIFGFDSPKDSEYTEELLKKLSYGPFYGWMNYPGAVIDIKTTPYVEVFSADESSDQFPMRITIDGEDKAQMSFFREQYMEDERRVGYYIEFKVDTDENGIPRPIYKDVYGK